MLIGFRQGLVRAPANFLSRNGATVSLQVPPNDTVIATILDGDTDYLISEKQSITSAWAGPFVANTNYWLYWDIHLVTGVRTFGYTTLDPSEGPTAPASPQNNQHWFDTTVNQTKVYITAINRWSRVIRVFAAQYSGGAVFTSLSTSQNFTGTQVGINTPCNAGALVFDNYGGALKKKNGTYFTTEDYAVTGVALSSQVKLGSIMIRAEADAYIPPLTIVQFTDFNKVRPASNHVINKIVYGLIEFEANTGDVVNVSLEGVITNGSWDWSSVGINTLLYVDGYGALTSTPSLPPVPVAVVIDKNAIMLRPSSVFMGGTNGTSSALEGMVTGDILIPTGFRIDMEDAPVEPTTLTNKAYVDAKFDESGTQVFFKINASDVVFIKGTPVCAVSYNDQHAIPANASAVDTSRVIGLIADSSVVMFAVGRVQGMGLFTATADEWDAVTGLTGGLTPGRDYFLKSGTMGGLTATPSTSTGEFLCKIGRAASSTILDTSIEPSIEL